MLKPETCPVLALAVLFFCDDARNPTSVSLYSGSNCKERFSNIMSTVVNHLTPEELLLLDCEKSDISPYSARKGATTYAS